MDLENELPGTEFEQEFALRLGRVTTAVVKPIAHLALDDEDEGTGFVRSIRKVHFASYEVSGFPEDLAHVVMDLCMFRIYL